MNYAKRILAAEAKAEEVEETLALVA